MAKKRKLQEEEPKHQPKALKSSASSSSDEESESEESDEVEELKQPSSQSSSEEEKSSEEEDEDNDEDEDEDEEQDDDQSKMRKVKKLLEPFSKDQLIAILKEATQSDPSVTAEIISSAESDPVHRKIFVHGLGWDATNETLITALKPFGAIEECNVVTDKTTGRSKGYGFVLFKTRAAARKALKEPQKKIGNRIAACQLASTGPVQNQNASAGPAPVAAGVNAVMMPALALGFNPGAVLLGQNPAAIGVLNPVLGGAFAGGITQSLNSPMGLNPGFGVQQGVTALNPGMISGYGSQATFQGLGAYQNSQVGQPSAPATAAAAGRPQTGTAPFVSR